MPSRDFKSSLLANPASEHIRIEDNFDIKFVYSSQLSFSYCPPVENIFSIVFDLAFPGGLLRPLSMKV